MTSLLMVSLLLGGAAAAAAATAAAAAPSCGGLCGTTAPAESDARWNDTSLGVMSHHHWLAAGFQARNRPRPRHKAIPAGGPLKSDDPGVQQVAAVQQLARTAVAAAAIASLLPLHYRCSAATASNNNVDDVEGATQLLWAAADRAQLFELLVAPLNLSTFREVVFQRQPQHFTARDPTIYSGLTQFEPSSVEAFLQGCVSTHRRTVGGPLQAVHDIILTHAGSMPRLDTHPVVKPALAAAYVEQGYTIVVNRMQHRELALARLAGALEVRQRRRTHSPPRFRCC
jgi:hypothetical protein